MAIEISESIIVLEKASFLFNDGIDFNIDMVSLHNFPESLLLWMDCTSHE